MREARDLFVAAHPDIECDGELHGDAALEPGVRNACMARFHARAARPTC